MNKMPDAQLCHIGLYAFDLETMVDFYSRVFGLVVTDRGHSDARLRHRVSQPRSDRASPDRHRVGAAEGSAVTPPSTRFRSGCRASRSCGNTIRGW